MNLMEKILREKSEQKLINDFNEFFPILKTKYPFNLDDDLIEKTSIINFNEGFKISAMDLLIIIREMLFEKYKEVYYKMEITGFVKKVNDLK